MKKSKRYISPDDWMYQQVIEAVAVFASHGISIILSGKNVLV